jgi:hypothetical protein
MERRMKIKLIANRDGGYTESFKMYRMDYDYARLVEETDPASQYYSDDDDTISLENEMRNQYQSHSSQNGIQPITATTLPPVPAGVSPHDDILNSIN